MPESTQQQPSGGSLEPGSAATLLGDGRVALILDVDALVAMRRRESARAGEPPILQAAE